MEKRIPEKKGKSSDSKKKYPKKPETVSSYKKDRKEFPVKKQDVKKTADKKQETKDPKNGSFVSRKPKTVDPNACVYAGKCGGCNGCVISYKEQLKQKQKLITSLVGKFGTVSPIIGMEDPFYYRNKIHRVFSHDRQGNPFGGNYKENSHFVVPVKTCKIENEKAQEILITVEKLLKSFKIKTYNEDTGFGLFRHCLIRTGRTSGEIMVVLVIGNPIFPSKNNFVKALRKEHPEITTVVLNINDKDTSMILGEREQVLYGPGFIKDTLCGHTFRISPKSFYQINPVQTEILYNTAVSFADLTGKETVLDAYCGIGTIGITAADHAKEVIGVELNPAAIRDARINARENHLNNLSFYTKDAGEFLLELAEENARIDVVFMDPPRSGSSETFLSCVLKLNPKKIVYISCGPDSLARDLEFLRNSDYKVEKIQPVDMFPYTAHVETVVLLSKLSNAKSTIDVKLDMD